MRARCIVRHRRAVSRLGFAWQCAYIRVARCACRLGGTSMRRSAGPAHAPPFPQRTILKPVLASLGQEVPRVTLTRVDDFVQDDMGRIAPPSSAVLRHWHARTMPRISLDLLPRPKSCQQRQQFDPLGIVPDQRHGPDCCFDRNVRPSHPCQLHAGSTGGATNSAPLELCRSPPPLREASRIRRRGGRRRGGGRPLIRLISRYRETDGQAQRFQDVPMARTVRTPRNLLLERRLHH
mmetsp:Transcript_4039/g.8592  ORF Transcript_4039/g.8592 Transcript_4039/m.8592 type:complete len:236 (-) Transcript_4039:259-966(-)